MPKPNASTGLRSEQLLLALSRALAGEPRALRELLARHGGLPSPRPNLELAAAFGEEVARHGLRARRLLEALASDESSAERAEAFLPVAAAFGFASLAIGEEDEASSLRALFELASDERPPVRLGARSALSQLGTRRKDGADRLVACFIAWTEAEDREARWWAEGVALELVAERKPMMGLSEPAQLFEVLERILGDLEGAPRAAQRSAARRRAMNVLPDTLAAVVGMLRGGDAWLEGRCAEARDPELRQAFAATIERLRKRGSGEKAETLRALEAALAASAKPPRDPTRSHERSGRGRRRG
jgi:hypothetical protein